MASVAPAIISRYQRKKKKKKGQQHGCLLSPICPNSFQLCSSPFPSALCFSGLACVGYISGQPFPSALCFSGLACVGYISGFLALGIRIGSANGIHCRRLECEKRMGSGLFPSLTPFLQSHIWLTATQRPLFSRHSALPDPLLPSTERDNSLAEPNLVSVLVFSGARLCNPTNCSPPGSPV